MGVLDAEVRKDVSGVDLKTFGVIAMAGAFSSARAHTGTRCRKSFELGWMDETYREDAL